MSVQRICSEISRRTDIRDLSGVEHVHQQLDVGLVNTQATEVTELQRIAQIFDVLIAVQEHFTHVHAGSRQRIHGVRLQCDHAIHLVKDGAIDLRRRQTVLLLDDLDVVRISLLTSHQLGRHHVLLVRRCPETDAGCIAVIASRGYLQLEQRIAHRTGTRRAVNLVTLGRIQRTESL